MAINIGHNEVDAMVEVGKCPACQSSLRARVVATFVLTLTQQQAQDGTYIAAGAQETKVKSLDLREHSCEAKR